MIAKTLLELIKKHKVIDYNGLEDTADRMSFQISVVILLLCGAVVTSKTFIFKPLVCYTAVSPTGANFDGYLRNYCWVTGTVPLLTSDSLDSPGVSTAADRPVNYYQWVPLILGLQCILFYAPRLLWQLLCYNKLGINLERVFADARGAAAVSTSDERQRKASDIAKILGRVFHFHRDRGYSGWARLRRRVFKLGSFFMLSERMGTWITGWYLLVKGLWLANVVGQLFLVQRFLGLSQSNFDLLGTTRAFFAQLLGGVEWTASGMFPRVVMCNIEHVKLVGADNDYSAQCVLPQNMINEKVFMFLWCWLHLVLFATVVGIALWLKKILFHSRRADFIKRCLKDRDEYRRGQRPLLDRFVSEFMRHDGCFIIMSMHANCGDMITSAVVAELWRLYQIEYASSNDTAACSDSCSEKDPNLLYPAVNGDLALSAKAEFI